MDALKTFIECWHVWLAIMEAGVLFFMLLGVIILYRKTKENEKEIAKYHGEKSDHAK